MPFTLPPAPVSELASLMPSHAAAGPANSQSCRSADATAGGVIRTMTAPSAEAAPAVTIDDEVLEELRAVIGGGNQPPHHGVPGRCAQAISRR